MPKSGRHGDVEVNPSGFTEDEEKKDVAPCDQKEHELNLIMRSTLIDEEDLVISAPKREVQSWPNPSLIPYAGAQSRLPSHDTIAAAPSAQLMRLPLQSNTAPDVDIVASLVADWATATIAPGQPPSRSGLSMPVFPWQVPPLKLSPTVSGFKLSPVMSPLSRTPFCGSPQPSCAAPSGSEVSAELMVGMATCVEQCMPTLSQAKPPGDFGQERTRTRVDKDSIQKRIDDFVRRWALDQRCVSAICTLEREDLEEVLTHFDARRGTKNVNAKFMVWMDSRLKRAKAQRQRMPASAEPASEEVLRSVLDTWSLDNRLPWYVQALPPKVQSELSRGFNPPPDTRSVDAKLEAVVKLQMKEESSHCQRLSDRCTRNHVMQKDTQAPSGALNRANSESGYRPPSKATQRPLCSAGKTTAPRKKTPLMKAQVNALENASDDSARRFATRWGLYPSNEACMRELPPRIQNGITFNFRSSGTREQINRKFVAFIHSFLVRDNENACIKKEEALSVKQQGDFAGAEVGGGGPFKSTSFRTQPSRQLEGR